MNFKIFLASIFLAAMSSAAPGQTIGNELGHTFTPDGRAMMVAGHAIHCAAEGCLSSGQHCDTATVSGQCMFPGNADPIYLCSETPGCIAVTCNSFGCFARSVADLTLDPNFNSMILIDTGSGSQFSDIRLKTAIMRVGTTVHSLPLYRFNYIGDDTRYEGVMAQDVMKVVPDAVTMGDDGYYRVNYTQLGTRMLRVD